MSKSRRWLAPALLLFAIVLIGTGITGMLGVSYMQHPSWTLVILPPVEMVLGCALLIFPLLRRLARESADQEESDRRAAGSSHPPQAS